MGTGTKIGLGGIGGLIIAGLITLLMGGNIGDVLQQAGNIGLQNETIQQGEFSEEEQELAMAKEQVNSSYIFGLENINSRMFNIGKNKLLLDRVYEADEILSSFDAVTTDDILQAAQLIGRAIRRLKDALGEDNVVLKRKG